MTEILPPALREKVAQLAAEIGQTVEEFVVQTVSARVEAAEFIKARFGVSKPGDLTSFLNSVPDRPPLPGDELPDEVAEWVKELKRTPRKD